MFVQDDLRLWTRFTLNLGLRWEFTSNPNEVNGRSSHYTGLFATDTLVVGNPLYKTPKDNFAPRVGFAWDLFGDGKTAVRGGFAMFDQMLFREYYVNGRQLPPFTEILSGSPHNLCFPHPLPCLPNPPTLATQMNQYQDNKQPYAMQWNLNVQKQLLPSTVLTVGYVGTRGLHLSRLTNPNVAVPAISADRTYFYAPNLPRRDPTFGVITFKSLQASSRYNALQVKLAHRLSKGLQVQGSYTWSHVLDTATGSTASDYSNGSAFPQNPWLINQTEKANSNFNQTHVLVVNYSYTFSFGQASKGFLGKLIQGWQSNGILAVSGGLASSVENSSGLGRDRSGASGAGVTAGASRPNLLMGPGCGNKQATGDPNGYFNVQCFQLQDPGYYGNLGRNTVKGPGLGELDFALLKNTALGEKKSLQFRAEFFNFLNRANFDLPNRTLFTAATGVPSGTGGVITATVTSSRQLQFGLKLVF